MTRGLTDRRASAPIGPRAATAWLVCYDIAEPRRLARVGRAAREFGVPLQYSVLWARLDGVELAVAMGEIATRIDPGRDDGVPYTLTFSIGRCFVFAARLGQAGSINFALRG